MTENENPTPFDYTITSYPEMKHQHISFHPPTPLDEHPEDE